MNKIRFLTIGIVLGVLVTYVGSQLLNTNATEVSVDFADHPQRNHDIDILAREKDDKRLLKQAKHDRIYFEKSSFKNAIDGLDIPFYWFSAAPPETLRNMPALVWVYGGIHDRFGVNYYPFIRDALKRGFVVIAPEYRGARGYGAEFYNAIDYGGLEVEDIVSAADYLSQISAIDSDRIAAIGWSHGGYIASLAAMRKNTPFARAVASVPVSNLIFRLSFKGPEYQRIFTTQTNIQALPHENIDLYKSRSPYYQVNNLTIPYMAQFATNDDDVNWEEAKMLADALKLEKANLAEVIIYDNPKHGHYLNRQVNLDTLESTNDTVQTDSWSHIWQFLSPLIESQ
jgi:dipeptidyl aminopeptidase/acylaminoacyl peptidase